MIKLALILCALLIGCNSNTRYLRSHTETVTVYTYGPGGLAIPHDVPVKIKTAPYEWVHEDRNHKLPSRKDN